MCSLNNFDRLISGSVSNTLEKQGIADASDIPRGRGKGNKDSDPDRKNDPKKIDKPPLSADRQAILA